MYAGTDPTLSAYAMRIIQARRYRSEIRVLSAEIDLRAFDYVAPTGPSRMGFESRVWTPSWLVPTKSYTEQWAG